MSLTFKCSFAKNSQKYIFKHFLKFNLLSQRKKLYELTGKCVFQQKVRDREELLVEAQQWASKFPVDLVDQVD